MAMWVVTSRPSNVDGHGVELALGLSFQLLDQVEARRQPDAEAAGGDGREDRVDEGEARGRAMRASSAAQSAALVDESDPSNPTTTRPR